MWLKRACIWTLIALLSPSALADDDYIPGAALRAAGLIKSWQLRVRLEKDQRLVDAYLVDDQVYLATDDGWVFAVHADTGASRWLRRITSAGYRVRRPCHIGDRVVFATPTTLLQLDQIQGTGKAKSRLKFPAGTAPASDGTRLFLGGLDQRVHAFQADNTLYGWEVITNGPITSTPVLDETNLFVASDDGTVYSCTADRKVLRWQTTVYGSVTADLAVNERGIYVPGRDQCLYLLDHLFGEVRWQARFSGPLFEPPVLTADVAYQYCPGQGLAAVNTPVIGVEERIRWNLPRGRMLLTVDRRYAYVLSQDGTVLVVGLADGKAAHTLPATGLTLGLPSPARTALYLAGPAGRVFCARPRGTPPVRQDAVVDALRSPEAGEAGAAANVAEAAKLAELKTPDMLQTSRKGAPLGGKSKVSRDFGGGGRAGGGSRP